MKKEFELERELIFAEENNQKVKCLIIKIKLYIIRLGGKDMIKDNKFKKIVKYIINILCMISALIIGIDAIEGITIPYAYIIVQVIAVINGVIGTYLLGQKIVKDKD